jgi:hypothetical protein
VNDDRTDREDSAILVALEDANGSPRTLAGDQGGEAAVRLYTETLGLLACALEPVAPPPAMRGRVMLLATGDETLEVTPAIPPLMPPRPVAPPAQRAAPAPVVATARPLPTRSASRWPLRLAAVLAVGLLGLSGWLTLQMQEQSGELARLRAEAQQAKARETESVKLREEVKALRGNFSLITSPAVSVCTLRAAPNAPNPQPAARGVLYVAADHQHWYLSLRGLRESSAGQQYQLWFLAADGRAVSGGAFNAQPGQVVELSSASMPAGTSGVSVTVERQGGSVIPTGPQVLIGDQVWQVL